MYFSRIGGCSNVCVAPQGLVGWNACLTGRAVSTYGRGSTKVSSSILAFALLPSRGICAAFERYPRWPRLCSSGTKTAAPAKQHAVSINVLQNQVPGRQDA